VNSSTPFKQNIKDLMACPSSGDFPSNLDIASQTELLRILEAEEETIAQRLFGFVNNNALLAAHRLREYAAGKLEGAPVKTLSEIYNNLPEFAQW
jgi:hypothetical protein